MPYGIRKSGDRYKVVNKQTGRVFGTHESQAKAKKQLAALYVNANPHNESKSIEVRILREDNGVVLGSIDVIEEAVKKEILARAAASLDIDPASLMQFIKDVDTEDSLPHGNWICMAAAKGMPLNASYKSKLKMMLGFFVRYKVQVVNAGNSANIFDYANYEEFRKMIFSFSKNAYDFDPTELPGVTKILDDGPYTLYKITAKSDSGVNKAAVASVAKMGNGTKWCTREEYNPSYSHAQYYLISNNPEETMFIVTKFNAPYAQLQANLNTVMDVRDRDVLVDESDLNGTYELSDVFAKAAKEFNLTRSTAKEKFLALVGIRTKKALEHFRSEGFNDVDIAMNLSRSPESMGFSSDEATAFYTHFIHNFDSDRRGHILSGSKVRRLTVGLFKTLLEIPMTGKALQFGYALAQSFLESGKNAARIPNDTVKDLLKQYLEKMSDDEKIRDTSHLLLAYCLFVQKAKWPEKEEAMRGIFEKEPKLKVIYDNLGAAADDESDDREHDIRTLVDDMTKYITSSPTAAGAAVAVQRTTERYELLQSLGDAILLYGRLPEIEEVIKRYDRSGQYSTQGVSPVRQQAQFMKYNYEQMLKKSYIAGIED